MYFCWTTAFTGHLFLRMGNLDKAYTLFLKSLRQFKAVNSMDGIAFSLEGMAALSVSLEQFDRAARLIAWADTARLSIHDRRPANEQTNVDQDIAAIQTVLDRETYEVAYEAGKNMTLESVVECVLSIRLQQQA